MFRKHSTLAGGPIGHVNAAPGQQVHKRIGIRWNIAYVVAIAKEGAQQFQDRFRNVEIIGTDVLLSGRVVVVDESNPFLRVGLVLKLNPTGDSLNEPAHATIDWNERSDCRTCLAIDTALELSGYRNGFDHSLQLGHRDLVIDTRPGKAVRREQPLIGTAFGEPHRPKDRQS